MEEKKKPWLHKTSLALFCYVGVPPTGHLGFASGGFAFLKQKRAAFLLPAPAYVFTPLALPPEISITPFAVRLLF